MNKKHLQEKLRSQIKGLKTVNFGIKTKRYSSEFKSILCQAIESGLSIQDVHKISGVSWGALNKWYIVNNYKEIMVVDTPSPPMKLKSATSKNENLLIFTYPNGLEIKIEDRLLTPDLVQLLKGA